MENILTAIGSVVTISSIFYTIVRNFRTDFNEKFDKMEKRLDNIDEKMFYLATGKSLAQAILEEKLKSEKQ